MGKVLIAAFDDKDEIAFDELLLFLKSNSHIKVVNAFPNDSCLKYDNLIIDSKYRMVEADGKSVELTNYEFEILYLLARHPGQVFSPREIYSRVWKDTPFGAENTVAVHIRHLREKLEINPAEPRYLKVVWGQGYKCENLRQEKR